MMSQDVHSRGSYMNETVRSNPRANNFEYMFSQVKSLTRRLLEDVSIVYRNYKVNYQVYQYSDAIMRLILPVELYSFMNSRHLEQMLDNTESKNYQQDQNIALKFKKAICMNQLEFQIPKYNEPKKTQICYKKSEEKQEKTVKMENAHKDQLNQVEQRINPHSKRTIRSRGLESDIAAWVLSELQAGKLVTKPLIMKKARQMGKQFKFKACQRWCDNFLKRNHELKALMYKRLFEESQSKLKNEALVHEIPVNKYFPQFKPGYNEDLRTFPRQYRRTINEQTDNEPKKLYNYQNNQKNQRYFHLDNVSNSKLSELESQQDELGFDFYDDDENL